MGKAIILGAGESGVGAAILAQSLGEEVWVSDGGKIADRFKQQLIERNIAFEEGQHTEESFFDADYIVKSPGIPESVAVVQRVRQMGKPIYSEIEFAARHTQARMIAITGSNGKTTTTALVHHLLQSAGERVGLAGNIGPSFARQVAAADQPAYVLEISSFQLDDIELFCPDVAVLLNITPDHLDRYQYRLSNYARAKLRIAECQGPQQVLIYNREDPETLKHLSEIQGKPQLWSFGLYPHPSAQAWVADGNLVVQEEEVLPVDELPLLGRHNQLNALAALLAVKAYGLSMNQVRAGLTNFQAIEHRLERVLIHEGITYINDSKATNVDAVYYALEAMQQAVIWLAGGVDKGNDYGRLQPLVVAKVKAILVISDDSEKFFQSFEVPVEPVGSMAEAIEKAAKWAAPGDAVLLSPACASFDRFDNYEDRGRKFKAAVRDFVGNEKREEG